MALEKQTVSYNFTKGVDTKTDEYQVSGKLTTLENGVFQTTGAVRKRNGYAEIGANSLTSGNAIAGYIDEIVAFDGSDVYSYSDDQDSFVIKGHKVAVDISQNAVIKNNYAQTYADSAYHTNGLKFFTWKDSSGTNQFNYSIVDEATGNNIVANKVLVSGATAVGSKVVGNYFVFIYIDQTTSYIKYIAVPIATPSTPAAAVTLATDFSGENRTATTTMLNRIYVAYTDASNNIKIFYLDSSLVKSAVQTLAVTCEADLALGADSVLSQIWVGYSDYTANVNYLVRNAALSGSVLGATLVTNSFQTSNLTIAANNGSGRIYYQAVASYTTPVQTVYYIWSATITNAGVVGTSAQFLRDVAIYSNAFYYNSDFYVGVLHQSDQQSTYFVLNSSGSAVAKIVPNLGGEVVSNWITSINQLSTDKFNIAIIERDLVTSEGGQLKFDVGVQETILTFSTPITTQFLGNNLHASGGILTMYDGVNVCEHGFNLYPENIGFTILPYGGNLPYTGTGSFQYEVTYDWTDNQGQLHQSAPSVAETISTYNLITFTGNTTSGSSVITNVSLQQWTMMPGFEINGAGIPTGTTFTSFASATSINISANATATATGVTFTVVAQDKKQFTTTANSKDISIVNSTSNNGAFYIIGSATTGSYQLIVRDASKLRVGFKIRGFGINNWITSISGNTVTMAGTSTETYTNGFVKVYFDYVPYTATAGNNWFTVFGLDYTWPKVGDVIEVPSLYANPVTITSVTLAFPASARIDTNGTNLISITAGSPATLATTCFDITHYVREGNTISGNGFTGAVNVTSVVSIKATVDAVCGVTNTNNYVIGDVYSVVMEIPTLRITDKITNPVVLSVWRTPLNETTFYRVTSVKNPLYNNVTVDYVEFTDNVSDITLIGNDLIYTTGGVLENIEVPSVKLLTSYRSRLIAVPSESPYSFWYSKQVVPGSPVQFTDAFVSNIDQKGGPITGIVAQDDKLILFKQSLIYYMVGDGPTSTGINNDFTQPQLISSDSGCINKKSIVITPIGTMYQSAKGIYLLSRALEVQFIGADVAGYNSYTVTSAQLVSNFNQVRFTFNNGITLMYDYYYQQWSVFTNYDAIDAAVVGASATIGTYYMIKTDGTVNKETNGQYLDNGSYIPLKVVTNWLNFAGLQGYERFYKVLVLGHYKSPHTLNFKSYFDFNETAFQETSITVDSDPTVYQYRIFLSRQKCESVKFELQDTELTPVGEGFYLSAIAFEVGIKRGLNKMAASVSYG